MPPPAPLLLLLLLAADPVAAPPPLPAGPPAPPPCEAWAHGPDELARVDLNALRVIRRVPLQLPKGRSLTDLGRHGARLLGITFEELLEIDVETGTTRTLAPLKGSFNALGGPGGRLFAMQEGGWVYEFDLRDGAARPLVKLPDGLLSSGDLVSLEDGRLLGTATRGDGSPDELVEILPDEKRARRLGPLPLKDVWGLASCGDRLFGLAEKGGVFRLDPATGAGTLIGRLPLRVWGASPLTDRIRLSAREAP